jgi:hypothetical protein
MKSVVGSLLDVPTHTVNMTTLRSTHDLWQSYSMDPYEEPSESTLAEFLTENEGKRCVVVLDVRLSCRWIDVDTDIRLAHNRRLIKLWMKRRYGHC